MKPILFAPLLLLALSACAANGMQGNSPAPVAASAATTPTASDPFATGEIVLVEPVAPVTRRGGNAAVAIGSTVLGAFIPGPWGSIASVTAGQAGQYALNSETPATRYHVRMPDGGIRTVTQVDPNAMGVGTRVQLLTLNDGSMRIIRAASPATPG